MSWYVARILDQLLAEVNASAPHRSKVSDGSIGDASHSSSTSDHNPCDCHDAVCARDYTHDPAGGFDSYAFADWLAERTKGPEARVKYVISDGRIASGQGQSYPAGVWRPYTGSNPHDHHVHVSVRHGADLFDNAAGWGWSGAAGPTPEPIDLTGGIDVLLYLRNPNRPAEIWAFDGMFKRYVSSMDEVDVVKFAASAQGVANVSDGSMGATEVSVDAWASIPVAPGTDWNP